MTDFLALACVLLALPGLLLARSGPVPVRLLTFAALVVLLVAALDLEQVRRHQEPARVAVLGTGDDVSAERLRSELTSDRVAVVAGRNAPWPGRLVRGALVAGPRAAELVVVWSGPLPEQAEEITGRGITALVPDTVLDLDPEQLQVWPVGAFEAMRPAGLEVRLADSTRTLVTEVAVTDPDGVEILRETVQLEPEAPVAFLPLVATRSGEHSVRLVAQVDGVNVQRWGTFSVAPAHPVLVVGAAAEQLAVALEVQGMEVAARSELPEDLEDWSVLVLLDPLSADEQLLLGTYLDGGGGLFVVGGEGGALPDRTEPLHEFLPVFHLDREVTEPNSEDQGDLPAEEDPPQEDPPEEETEPPPPDPPAGDIADAELDPITEEVDRRLVGMVLVVDRSNSMGTLVQGGNQIRMDYAKRAALATAQALQEGDELGVVTFGNQGFGRTELPLTEVTDWQTIQTRVSRLSHHRESTFLSSGLERAGELLVPSQLAVRFVVVVTDGIFQDDLLATSRARRLAAQGISVSLIRIGGSEGGVIQSRELAKAGRGTYHQPRNAREVPRLVVAEVRMALGRAGRELPDVAELDDPAADPDPTPPPEVAETAPPPVEDPPVPDEPAAETEPETRLRVRAVADSVLLEPRPAGGFPDLGGMDAVTGRPDAHVLLVGGEEGLPLLAFANRGLGRIGVWAADFTGAWGEAWREDPYFPGRLATWVQSLFPPREELPRDLFEESSVWPPVPTPAEIVKLNRIAGTVLEIGDYEAPGPRTVVTAGRLAQDLAIAGALALVLLALGEYLLLRWHVGVRP